MSMDWIEKNIKKLMNSTDSEQAALGKKLMEAFKNEAVDGMVVTTKIVDGVIQDPVAVYKGFSEIGKNSF